MVSMAHAVHTACGPLCTANNAWRWFILQPAHAWTLTGVRNFSGLPVLACSCECASLLLMHGCRCSCHIYVVLMAQCLYCMALQQLQTKSRNVSPVLWGMRLSDKHRRLHGRILPSASSYLHYVALLVSRCAGTVHQSCYSVLPSRIRVTSQFSPCMVHL